MSVTIHPTSVPGEGWKTALVPCSFCTGDGKSPHGGECVCLEYHPFIVGIEEASVAPWPELNVSNANFAVMATALGLPNEPGGDLPPEAVGLLDAQLASLSASALSEAQDFASSEVAGRSSRIIMFAASDESWSYRISKLHEVVKWASLNGRGISWG